MQESATQEITAAQARDLYLELLKKCLTRYTFPDTHRELQRPLRKIHPVGWAVYPFVSRTFQHLGLRICRKQAFDGRARALGQDSPPEADTMIGLARLDNLRFCIEQVLRDGVPGDLIETGVWRGGASIFMRGCLQAYGNHDRLVWVADSFEGLPLGRYTEDKGDNQFTKERHKYLAISLDQVKANFQRYGLLDEQVRFLKGWFRDTLRAADIKHLAVIRLDGDLYSSTMDALELYPKLSPGGYAIIDDYHAVEACQRAVDEFRVSHRIDTPLKEVDGVAVYWRKE